jgi:glycosyltransferase involved in cell wall biosynthesis
MRIAFVTTEYVTESNYDGGLANYVHRVALSLKELGHEPIIIVLTNLGKDEVIFHKGIDVHRARFMQNWYLDKVDSLTRRRFSKIFYFLRASWILNGWVKKIHKEKPISIIQYTQLGGVGFFRPRKIPNITRLSSFTPLWRKYGGYSGVPPKQLQLQAIIEKWALKRAKKIFGPCKQVAMAVEKEVGKPVEIIESPFILDITTEDESLFLEKLKNKKYFLCFGTLNELKGVATIAETLPLLFTKHSDIYFVFAGKESLYQGEPMMNYVRKKAEKFVERVIHLGKLKHEQLYPIIKQAFAVVLPSLFDNFPNTCLEAMWHKKVIIGTEGTSFDQLLTDGVSGFLCEPGNSGSLLNKMEIVSELSEMRRNQIGESAYQRVLMLRPEKAVRQLVSFYESVISRRLNRKVVPSN